MTCIEWLEAGGIENVFETVRRYGWTLELVTEWEYLPCVVGISDCEAREITINVTKSIKDQFYAAVTAFQGVCSYGKNSWGSLKRFDVGDDAKMSDWDKKGINEFLKLVRTCSEVTAALIGAGKSTDT